MKKMIGKNQLMITALAIMIAVAGYINFAGNKVTDEDLVTVTSDQYAVDTSQNYIEEEDYATTFDITEEDTYEAMDSSDIISLDSDLEGEYESVPGEAVYTSSASISALSGARLQKEQMRSENQNTLMEIINNANVADSQKQQAIDTMVGMTSRYEKETSAEILLEAKGFSDAIVTIQEDNVDVVVEATELSENQRAQIEDIVIRKTGIAPENIVISTLAQ